MFLNLCKIFDMSYVYFIYSINFFNFILRKFWVSVDMNSIEQNIIPQRNEFSCPSPAIFHWQSSWLDIGKSNTRVSCSVIQWLPILWNSTSINLPGLSSTDCFQQMEVLKHRWKWKQTGLPIWLISVEKKYQQTTDNKPFIHQEIKEDI